MRSDALMDIGEDTTDTHSESNGTDEDKDKDDNSEEIGDLKLCYCMRN